METSNNLSELIIARHLILHAQRAEDRRKGKKVVETSLKDEMDADSVVTGGNAPVGNTGAPITQQKTQDVQIKLNDFAGIQESNSQQADNLPVQVQVNIQQTVESKASLSYTVLEKVDGLVRLSQTQAETDRYRFDFSDGATFKITDKWSNRSTTIWGDPHVDVNDVEGTQNGDFKDLKTSNSQTTLMLQDGTRVTFTARDDSMIEAVDIFKGNQHLDGIGQASAKWNDEKGLFGPQVNQDAAKASSVPMGDTVYAGGDGNDWFTADGKLLWGKTTGPTVTNRPYAVMQLDYQEKTTQEVNVQVNKQA